MHNQLIYLDSHASTRVDQDVLASMLPYFTEHYANGSHREGARASRAVEESRLRIASFIGASPSELVFTSSATEAINLALLGLAAADRSKKHIVTQQTEHKAVLASIEFLEKQGYTVTRLPVDSVGRINLEELCRVVSEDTLVVAIMLANNEVGTVQPVEAIGEICRDAGTRFFCDITQGLGWHPVDVDRLHIDLASMSAHKIYGPKGIGALFVRRRHRKVVIDPVLFGGDQERGLRPGTLNVPAIVGFGRAIEQLQADAPATFDKVQSLRDRLQARLFAGIEGLRLNGCPVNRHPANLNVSIPQVVGEQVRERLSDIMFSTGSACNSGSARPSHVLTALNLPVDQLNGAIRLGVSKYNTAEEIDYASERIIDAFRTLAQPSTSVIFREV